MNITILGIESSCDDTSAAVVRDRVLLSNVIASQAVHEQYGGVIPELASRAHQQNIIPVVDTALRQAGITLDEVDAIAPKRVEENWQNFVKYRMNFAIVKKRKGSFAIKGKLFRNFLTVPYNSYIMYADYKRKDAFYYGKRI